ncbi:MAG: UvrD-helicase domain-containing protein, partial [Acidobacteriota bacterium]
MPEQGPQVTFKKLYAQLNPQQQVAVDTIEGPVMVVAGPGTGKTQTLAMRIANILLQTQMDPWNILCLTFTESGVVAMRERLRRIIGPPAYYVRIHTFHSFCNDIIQEHPNLFARSRQWQALSDVERVELMQELIDRLPGTSPLKPFGNPYLYLKDVISNIQALKQEDITPEQFGSVLRAIETFLQKSQDATAAFFALKPSERSEASCRKIHTTLQKTGKEASLPASIVNILESMWMHFE